MANHPEKPTPVGTGSSSWAFFKSPDEFIPPKDPKKTAFSGEGPLPPPTTKIQLQSQWPSQIIPKSFPKLKAWIIDLDKAIALDVEFLNKYHGPQIAFEYSRRMDRYHDLRTKAEEAITQRINDCRLIFFPLISLIVIVAVSCATMAVICSRQLKDVVGGSIFWGSAVVIPPLLAKWSLVHYFRNLKWKDGCSAYEKGISGLTRVLWIPCAVMNAILCGIWVIELLKWKKEQETGIAGAV